MQSDGTNRIMEDSTGLLRSVAEQLKSPLTTIVRQTELGQLGEEVNLAGLLTIQTHAAAALNIVDSYLLGLQLIQAQQELPLEPVSVSSVLTDIAHELSRFAEQYDIQLELHVAGRYEPVMAHRQGLHAALLALGYALIESHPAEDGRLRLAVHRTPHGIVTGLYGRYEQLDTGLWRKARPLVGRAPRPFSAIHGSGAGLFVADAILQAMATRLRVSKYDKQRGFVATFLPSQQLHFV